MFDFLSQVLSALLSAFKKKPLWCMLSFAVKLLPFFTQMR